MSVKQPQNPADKESLHIEIISYRPQYKEAFKELNEEWIQKHFEMEESDRKALHEPESYILDKGGAILFAMHEGEAIGTCALIKGQEEHAYDFELAKMAVSPKVQGKGIGYLLGQAAAKKAKELGGSLLYLESNTKLGPALGLYRKLGFQEVSGHPTPYARCNIQMEMKL